MMNIKTRSINFDLTPAINDYINKKLSPLSKFIPNSEESLCEVEIGRTTRHHNSGDIFRAEVNLSVPGMNQFYAVAEEADLYSAIDVVRDEIERSVVSQKTKRDTIFRRGGAKVKNLLKMIDPRNLKGRGGKWF